ncbi:ATP-binding protein [Nocardiopsis sp. L17-MgMaSL7]|uniref:ATP-binding protein n=1 Tax=Nocardiopsis sp. L17-MgMaSL7 TaxID=1938893 RepID=UPI000D718837|nr:ATP-binding protein [Nocardiopsis sp. L17-MgMaSL7]PWV47844.1 two-component system sensor histidine kinase BaeS [Nocardiopsis sp. L17-MgMaSL7]
MSADRPRGGRWASLRHSLLFRLLAGSVLVAVCSITATAWLSVQRTSESITTQQGETLTVDTHIHDTLVGYAAAHRDWSAVAETVDDLAEETGRRVVLTTEGRAVIADSAAPAQEAGDPPPLPTRTSSVVDPLAVDVTLVSGNGDRIDPRAVGPFALTEEERGTLRGQAEQGVSCLESLYGLPAEVVTGPSGRPAVEAEGGDAYAWADCGLNALDQPVGGEVEALADLNARASDCGDPEAHLEYVMDGRTGGLVITGSPPVPAPIPDDARPPAAPEDPVAPDPEDPPEAADPGEEVPVPEPAHPNEEEPAVPSHAPGPIDPNEATTEVPQVWPSPGEVDPAPGAESLTWSRVELGPEEAACLDAARRAQLDPHVAPAALLFIDDPAEGPEAGLSLSREGALRLGGVVLLILVLTVVVSTTIATRLLRPVHALTDAVNHMREAGGPTTRVEVRDAGEIGRLAEAFNEMSEHLERAEDQRKAMVSDVSHELRTPLSNLRGWLEAVQDGVVDPDPDRMEMLLGETLLLQAVIDDLQDLALADAGRLRLSPEPVEVGPLVARVVAGHELRAEEAGVRLVDESRDVTLVADRTRMLQLLGNLVGNALRHTPEGGTVTVQAYRAGPDAVIRVVDTGVGIAEQDLPHVFDRFWRADRSRNRRTGGSGLGLAIVRGLVELHGGSVTADSTVGEGTAFTLRMPLAGPPAG